MWIEKYSTIVFKDMTMSPWQGYLWQGIVLAGLTKYKYKLQMQKIQYKRIYRYDDEKGTCDKALSWLGSAITSPGTAQDTLRYSTSRWSHDDAQM